MCSSSSFLSQGSSSQVISEMRPPYFIQKWNICYDESEIHWLLRCAFESFSTFWRRQGKSHIHQSLISARNWTWRCFTSCLLEKRRNIFKKLTNSSCWTRSIALNSNDLDEWDPTQTCRTFNVMQKNKNSTHIFDSSDLHFYHIRFFSLQCFYAAVWAEMRHKGKNSKLIRCLGL